MVVAPPIYVQAPAVTPSRFGLLSAGDLVIGQDPHLRNGIEWQPKPCGPAKLDPSECGDPANRTVDDGVPTLTAGPITLYNGFTCRSVGLTEAEMLTRAQDALAAGESAALESTLWTEGTAPGQAWFAQPLRLMIDGTTEVISGTPVPLVKGIGLLEAHLDTEYSGVGVIHAPRKVASYAAERSQIDTDAGRKVTTLGTRWSFGNYPLTGPDGTPAAADTAWLVATGAVSIRRTDVTPRPGNLAAALNKATNEVYFTAERTYVVSWECVTAAVLVTLASLT